MFSSKPRTLAPRLLALALSLLITAPAWALGLGQLRVKSGPEQPFLAEIPVVAADPSELMELSARLASPEAYTRIGLPAPGPAVASLRFEVGNCDDGSVCIRVSGPPMRQPLVNFLVEVEWAQGKLVREYSALINAPQTVAPVAAPMIEAPGAAVSSNVIDRSAAPATAAPASTVPPPNAPGQPPAQPAAPGSSTATATGTATGRPLPQAGDSTFAVKPGQTLSGIVQAMDLPADERAAMLESLVALNPDAFINGRPDRLLAGAVLRAPQGATMPEAGAVARAAVRSRMASGAPTRARGQPGRAASPRTAAVTARPASSNNTSAPSANGSGPRLQIVPPTGANGTAAGSGSGPTNSNGNSDMAQQLQQSQETVASRDSEVAELQTRVKDLEAIRTKQQQLIALKDSQLASAQQKLAAQQQAGSSGAPGGLSWLVWPALAAAMALLALWMWWKGRRARPRTLGPSPMREPIVLPVEMADADTAEAAPADVMHEPHTQASDAVPGFASTVHSYAPTRANADALAAAAITPPDPLRLVSQPTWAGATGMLPTPSIASAFEEEPAPTPTPVSTVAPAPTLAPAAMSMAPASASVASAPAPDPLRSHLQLAQTYIDLGDNDTARTLLDGVVAQAESAELRDEAERLLRTLV